jgi:hypothetical protein
MKLKISKNLSEFKTVLDLFSSSKNTANFMRYHNILVLETFNGTSLLASEFKKSFFDEIEFPEETVTVNIIELSRVIKKQNKEVFISTSDNVLKVVVDNKHEYAFPLMNTEPAAPPLTPKELPITLNMDKETFSSVIEGSDNIEGETLTLYSNKHVVKAMSKNGQRKYEVELSKIPTGIEVKSIYGTGFLSFLTKYKGETQISFGDHTPLHIKMNHENHNVLYVLAPRVDYD